MTDDHDHDTDEYRVKTNQPGRATKPVHLSRDSSGTVHRVAPGDTFEVPAGTDLSAFADRVERVAPGDGEEEEAVWSRDDDGDHHLDREAAEDDGDGDDDAAEDADTSVTTQTVADDDADEQAADDADGSDDGEREGDAEPVNPADVAARLGYADCENVDEVRATVREASLSDREKRALVRYESQHADRKTAKAAIRDA